MAEVKFVNAAKYKGVRYPAHTPFQVADEDVDSLVNSGAIVLVPPQVKEAESEGEENEGKNLDEMTVNELKAYAAEKDIDISKAEKKADILAAIKESEGEGEENA